MIVSEPRPWVSRKDAPTMALDHSALPDILEVLKTAEVDNRIRQEAETIYQALIEAQLTPVIGAYQRTEARTEQRNGHRQRTITTTAGTWSRAWRRKTRERPDYAESGTVSSPH